jgi:2-polyprenyl-6-methoxyphenol hydroxylase-like FAD-dependent oxidoreductase
MLLVTRPRLEWHLRRRVSALPSVTVRPACAVAELIHESAGSAGTVTGVRLKGSGEVITADLVIDASGSGSQTPQHLVQMGYPAPQEDTVRIGLGYTSRLYRRPADAVDDWRLLIEYPRSTADWRAGFIGAVEGDRWMVSLNGYFEVHAPTDDAGFLAFSRRLVRSDLHDLIQHAEPLSEAVTFKIPVSRRRRYERLARFPENLVVLGDALCVFNPIFGQGMSVAAQEAELLRRHLAAWKRGDLVGFARLIRRQIARPVELPWMLTRCLDLHYPQSHGARPFGLSLLMWYITRLIELTSTNRHIYNTFVNVISLEKGIAALLAPQVAVPVLAYGIKSLFVPLHRRANTDVLPAPVS